jgi:hypothetical protein
LEPEAGRLNHEQVPVEPLSDQSCHVGVAQDPSVDAFSLLPPSADELLRSLPYGRHRPHCGRWDELQQAVPGSREAEGMNAVVENFALVEKASAQQCLQEGDNRNVCTVLEIESIYL